MASKIIDDNQPIAEINVIPFVDIVLVILIIFMVTAPIIIKTGFSLDLPKTKTSDTITSPQINISINAEGRVLLNGKDFDPKQIEEYLQRKQMPPEAAYALISADKNVLHGQVISIINTLKSMGLKKVAIATKKTKQ